MKTNLILAGMALFAAQSSFAQGSGARGGGNTVDVNGTKRLEDLVTTFQYHIKSGAEIYESTPKLKESIAAISSLDWYFGNELKKEIFRLQFRFTGKLFKLDPRGYSPIVQGDVAEFKKAKQAAIRFGYEVYVDQNEFDGLQYPGDQAKLIIHEALHAYLPMDLIERKLKMFSFMKVLDQVINGKIKTTSELHAKMKEDEIDFPATSEELLPYQKQVEYLTASHEERQQIILSDADAESLADIDVRVINPLLAPWDQQYQDALSTLTEDLSNLLMQGSADDFKKLLTKTNFKKLDIDQIVLSRLSHLSPSKQDLFVHSDRLAAICEKVYREYESISLIQGEFNILADSRVQALGSTPAQLDPVALVHISPRRWSNVSERDLPVNLQALAEVIQLLYKKNELSLLRTLVTENVEFYRALGLKQLFQQLPQMQNHFPVEKTLAPEVLAEVRDGMIDEFVQRTVRGLRPEAAAALKQMISIEKFKQ